MHGASEFERSFNAELCCERMKMLRLIEGSILSAVDCIERSDPKSDGGAE